MSTSSKTSKRNNLEADAAAAERDVQVNTDVDRRLRAAIRGAELYMQALTLADSPAVRKRLDAKAKQLLATAETLKANQTIDRQQTPAHCRRPHPVSTRKLTIRENIILLEGSKLNGAVFKPWTTPPTASDFELKDGQTMFTDLTDYPLSPLQLESFAGWERAPIALAAVENNRSESRSSSLTPCMLSKIEGIDLVQDVTSDCSVVASLCAGAARAGESNRKILRAIMFPYDNDSQRHIIAANGKYIFRFYFNGCWRRVEIDDRLPTSNSKRTLHVVDRAHPDLLWPALLEKAYLKIRGGYDFPGSNSATDVAVMTGWIPQQLFLHDDDVDPAQIWNELFDAFVKGDILLTLGTGRLGKREQKQLGLAPDHDYAVLDMQQVGDLREMLIKNPWADGEVWKGAARRKPHPGHEVDDLYAIPLSPIECEDMIPGTFWMDFDHIFQYFQNAYVNWNPSLFTVREDIHFTMQEQHANNTTALPINNPQFAVTSSSGGEVWLLLSRHFRTGDYTSANNGKNGYISLYLFENDGKRIFSATTAKVRGPFVDSPNTILRFTLTAHRPLTVVVLCQDMPAGSHNFSLSALANASISLNEAQQQFHPPTALSAAWTRSTSGGNSDSPHYLQNPQFGLSALHKVKIALVLRVDDSVSSIAQNEIPVKLAIVRSDGSRITKLRRRETTITSGDYRRGSAVIETTLESGSYTVICSTFEQGQHARFSLSLYTESTQTPLRLTPIASERSGRLSLNVAPAVFSHDVRKLIAPMTITRTTSVIVLAFLVQGKSSSLFKVSIEKGQGPNRVALANSADEETDYNSLAHGLRVTCTGLTPALSNMATGGIWLVVERPEQSSDHELKDHVVRLELLAEERIDLGPWAPLDD